jgi:hypothetical protein
MHGMIRLQHVTDGLTCDNGWMSWINHPLGMEGTLSAAVPGVGVTTGAHTAAQLREAGASWTVDSLTSVVEAIRD